MAGASSEVLNEKSALRLKRLILEQTEGYGHSPKADQYRMQAYRKLRSRYDALKRSGLSEGKALDRIEEETDLFGQMKSAGFASGAAETSRYRRLGETEVFEYLKACGKSRRRKALGASLVPILPFPLLLYFMISESTAGLLIGGTGMFFLMFLSIGLFIRSGISIRWNRARKGQFSVDGALAEKLDCCRKAAVIEGHRNSLIGIVLILTFLLPLSIAVDCEFPSPLFGGWTLSAVMLSGGIYKLLMSGFPSKEIERLLKKTE